MSTGVREIPLARPLHDEREEELVLEVLRSGWLSNSALQPAEQNQ